MTQTAWVLSLTQFYLGLGFLLFFLALELGLAWVLFAFRMCAHRGDAAMLAYRFWARVFALSVIVAFASGLPLLLQFGTLWPRLMDRAGEVIGPLVGLAVLMAFVFKSCFLGAMLYGQRALSNRAHSAVVGMVAVGTSLAAWWVVVLLGWFQWPVGTLLVDGRYQVLDWGELMRAGLAPVLFGVLLTGGLLLGATLMLGVTATRTRTRPSDAGDRRVYAVGLWLALGALVVQTGLAFQLGRDLMPVQPERAAAIIPQWTTGSPHPLSLVAWPEPSQARNRWGVYTSQLPDWLAPREGETMQGLSDLAGIHPPVWPTFTLPRLAALLAAVLGVLALWHLWRGWRLRYEPDQLGPADRVALRSMPWVVSGLQLAGWGYLLVGNLPYAVYGTVTLREVATMQPESVLWGGLGLYALVYLVLAVGFYRLLRHTVRHGVVPVARHRRRA